MLQNPDNMDVEPPPKRIRLSDVSNGVTDDPRRKELKRIYDVLSLSLGDSLEDVDNNAL